MSGRTIVIATILLSIFMLVATLAGIERGTLPFIVGVILCMAVAELIARHTGTKAESPTIPEPVPPSDK